MPNRTLRFLHAADFHLETPLGGLAEVPEHLRDVLIDAPWSSARAVFDTALSEEVDFVVLSGGLVDLQQAAPQSVLGLAEQFVRLAEKPIAVYWAGGPADPPEAWPAWLPLPDNVRRFPRGRIEQILHHRDGLPVAKLIGASVDPRRAPPVEEMQPDPAGLLTLGVLSGEFPADLLRARELSYWALGGRAARNTLFSTPQTAHWPGSPQGRHPGDDGPHGCTLVQVDEQGACRVSPVPTDAVRWHAARLTVDAHTTADELRSLLAGHVQMLLESRPSRAVLVEWTIAGQGPLWSQLRRGPLAGELLGWLRETYRGTAPSVWSVALETEPAATLAPELYEQETILGDFLRQIRHYQMNDGEALDLEPYVDERFRAGTLGSRLALAPAEVRRRALSEAALLGADLLQPENPSP